MTQRANHLTIRDAATGEVLDQPYVGSCAMMTRDYEGRVRDLETCEGVRQWLRHLPAAERNAQLDRRITVRDEYRY
jgi:hypothetical protein